jgi:hypothetical protein
VGSPAYELRPRRIWYLVAAGLAALTLIAVAILVWRAAAAVPATPVVLEPGSSQVRVEREGLTVYSSELQANVRCRASTADGADVPLRDPSGTEELSAGDGRTWYVALRSVKPVPAGVYTVSCEPLPAGVELAAGPRASALTFIALVLGAVLTGFLGLLTAGVVALVVLLRRRGHRRRLRSEPGT